MLSAPSAGRVRRPPGQSHVAPGERAPRTLIWLVPVSLAVAASGLATAYGFWTGSGQHLLKLEAALGISTLGLIVVPVTALARSRSPGAQQLGALRFLLMFAAALLSTAAALVHLAVFKQHFDEYWLYGVFFAVLGPAQLIWAVWVLVRPSGGVLWIGAVGNLVVVAFFIVTRTVGTLTGPEATTAAKVGFGDVATTVFEALVALLGAALIRGAQRARQPGSAPRGAGALDGIRLAGIATLLALVVVPQLALALQSAIASAPFIAPAG